MHVNETRSEVRIPPSHTILLLYQNLPFTCFCNYFQVFEGAIAAIPLSVDLWVHYLNFASLTTKGQLDGPQLMRR